MRFHQLIKGLKGSLQGAPGDPTLRGVAENSKLVKKGDLFIAVPGAKADGREFAKEAVAQGAAALLVEKRAIDGLQVPQFVVPEVRAALARVAHRFYGAPSQKVKVIGVTGTKGKTTTTFLIRSLLRSAGQKTALFGTIAYEVGSKRIEANNTTPSALVLAQLLAQARKAGCSWAVMEVSSHALDMGRVKGIEFRGAAFTNLGRDHLDYHKDFAHYFAAKKRLFTQFPTIRARVANADDAHGKKLLRALGKKGVGYGIETPCRYQAKDVDHRPGHIRFSVQGHPFEAPISGLFNIYNALAAVAVLRELGFSWTALQRGLEHAPAVPGRFEKVNAGQDFTVLVDYAHTSDALEQALTAAREILETPDQKLISVFGCGGDRDRTKRPLMGRISAQLADLTVVTSDNPRTEDPKAILKQIVKGIPAGLQRNGHQRVFVQQDRGAAIRLALSKARAGDLVLIAGKGHETYQILGNKKIHFDDREVAKTILKRLLPRRSEVREARNKND
ncbi:MAG TPA: UDP-N-acetylmuramoyl-L-alanyl-D-glutamate--2,6-diaminopimelate ligase [bacterium]|nr:UDP-N-acetylmuramoyl-L-alanyl-D-glutamate--2,6-diaminopimelate ligase [bacterium]